VEGWLLLSQLLQSVLKYAPKEDSASLAQHGGLVECRLTTQGL